MDTVVIYALCHPATGEIRYIGKANDAPKRLAGHLRDARRRRTPVYDWMKKLTSEGLSPTLRILMHSWDWRVSEREVIRQYRSDGFRLLNLADGGDEPHCSPEARRRSGERLRADTHGDPMAERIWWMKSTLSRALRQGLLSDKAKDDMRMAAARCPQLFKAWATI